MLLLTSGNETPDPFIQAQLDYFTCMALILKTNSRKLG